MCKIKSKEPVKLLPATIKAVVLGLSCALSVQIASAATLCIQCPVDAEKPGMNGAFDVYLNEGGVPGRRVSGQVIGRCQTNLFLVAQLNYLPGSPHIGAGFTGGHYRWTLIARGGANVFEPMAGEPTPPNMDMIIVTDVTKPCATAVPDGFTKVRDQPMIPIPYTVTTADANAGFLQWLFDDSVRPTSTWTNLMGNCGQAVSVAGTTSVLIAPPTSCSVTPDERVCVGSPASFTVSAAPTVNGPFTFTWRKGCPGAGAVITTSATLTITNAQLSDGGCYEVTVTDVFGCTTTCQATLTVNPNPVVSIRVSEVELCWESVTNKAYQVQYRSALTTNLWTNWGAPIQGSGMRNCIKDPVPVGEPRRFFRVVAVP